MTMISDDDARMVADRLGLTPDDAEECRQALQDVTTLGYDGFIDQTFREVATAVKAAYAGQRPTPEVTRRAEVRKRIAVGLTELLDLRQQLAQYDGPRH